MINFFFQEKALKCLASWLVLELPPDMTTNHVALCFDFIRQPELFEVSNLFTVDLSLIHAPPSISRALTKLHSNVSGVRRRNSSVAEFGAYACLSRVDRGCFSESSGIR